MAQVGYEFTATQPKNVWKPSILGRFAGFQISPGVRCTAKSQFCSNHFFEDGLRLSTPVTLLSRMPVRHFFEEVGMAGPRKSSSNNRARTPSRRKDSSPSPSPIESDASDERQNLPSTQTIDFGPLADSIAFQLRRAHDVSAQRWSQPNGAMQLKPGWYAILVLISQNPGINQAALSWANGRDKSSLTPILKELESHGAIRRQRTSSDRRSSTLSITQKGIEQLAVLTGAANELEDYLDRVVEAQNKPLLLHLLRLIAAPG